MIDQPEQIHEMKDFLLTAIRKDACRLKIERIKNIVQLKVHCLKYLYTLCVHEEDKADKLKKYLRASTSYLMFMNFIKTGILKLVVLKLVVFRAINCHKCEM